jgi:predicted transglutaminase-like cysteine proteinase
MILSALIAQAVLIHLPYPWLEHCYRAKDPGCVVERLRLEDLIFVNMAVAGALEIEENADPLDPWEAFPPSRRGDCDDHVMTVRAALLALGVNASWMRVELGTVIADDGSESGHAVLVVTLEGKDWVLDLKTPDQAYRPSARPYKWRLKAVQPLSGAAWSTEDRSR